MVVSNLVSLLNRYSYLVVEAILHWRANAEVAAESAF